MSRNNKTNTPELSRSRGPLFYPLLAAMVMGMIVTAQNAYSQATSGSPAGVTTTTIPEALFGMIRNSTGSGSFPSVNFGIERYWDTGPAQWAGINTAKGSYTWDTLDTMLAVEYSNENQIGNVAFYTLSRTPNWASSSQNDQQCNYWVSGSSKSYEKAGQCDAPSDLNPDGTGTNQHWRDWVTAIVQHVNGKDGAKSGCTSGGYTSCHSYVKYWEIWNEVDHSDSVGAYGPGSTNLSWRGTYAQLVRMAEDARCIIKGQGTIHNYTKNGGGEGDLKKSVTCANSGYATTGIDTNAQIVMPSTHDDSTNGSQLYVGQNFLYCNHSPASDTDCNAGAAGDQYAGADAVDVINWHNKPGNVITDYNQVETQMGAYYSDIQGVLTSVKSRGTMDTSKPLFNGEAGWSGASGNAWQCAACGSALNSDEQAAFIARYYLIMWSLGYATAEWYDWDGSNQLSGHTDAIDAYTQVQDWMVGDGTNKMSTTCAIVSASEGIWACSFTGSGGYQAKAIWDTKENCNNGCTTTKSYSYDIGTGWLHYLDLAGDPPTKVPSNNKPPLGVKPILLENQ